MPQGLRTIRTCLFFALVLGGIAQGGISGRAAALAAAPEANLPELRFDEMFARPVGPRGLELSAAVRALDGRRVRIRGYRVSREAVPPDTFLLAPFPLQLHETEYGLAEDLPPTIVFVDAGAWRGRTLPIQPGPVTVTGFLQLGNREEPDGRISSIRLTLDGPDPAAEAFETDNKGE